MVRWDVPLVGGDVGANAGLARQGVDGLRRPMTGTTAGRRVGGLTIGSIRWTPVAPMTSITESPSAPASVLTDIRFRSMASYRPGTWPAYGVVAMCPALHHWHNDKLTRCRAAQPRRSSPVSVAAVRGRLTPRRRAWPMYASVHLICFY